MFKLCCIRLNRPSATSFWWCLSTVIYASPPSQRHGPSPCPSSQSCFWFPTPFSNLPPDALRLFYLFLQPLPSPRQSLHSPYLSFLAHLPTCTPFSNQPFTIYTGPDPLLLCQTVNVALDSSAGALWTHSLLGSCIASPGTTTAKDSKYVEYELILCMLARSFLVESEK